MGVCSAGCVLLFIPGPQLIYRGEVCKCRPGQGEERNRQAPVSCGCGSLYVLVLREGRASELHTAHMAMFSWNPLCLSLGSGYK